MSNNILSLTGGELTFIMNPTYSKGLDMIKIQISDLIFRGVIQLEKKRVPINNGVGTVNHFYITKGIHFNQFNPQDFERYFIQPLLKETKKLPLGIYALYILGKFKNESFCKEEYFYPALKKKQLIKKSWNPLSVYKTTDKGEEIKNFINSKIGEINKSTSLTVEEYCNLIHTSGLSFLTKEKDINWKNLEEIRLDALQLILNEINSLTKNKEGQPIFNDQKQQEYLNLMIHHLSNEHFSFLNFSENFYDHMDLGFDSEL